MVVVLALVALYVGFLLEPAVALLANLNRAERLGSEIATALVLQLVVLDEVVNSDSKLLRVEVRVMFSEPADLIFQTLLEGQLLFDVLRTSLGCLRLGGRFLFAHKIICSRISRRPKFSDC